MEAVGGDRGCIDKAICTHFPRRAERVDRPLDVDGADRFFGRVAGDHESQVHDDIAAGERVA